MGDLKEVYEAMNENKKVEKKKRLQKNLDILLLSGIAYSRPTQYQCVVRDYNGKSASFYLSTNKWVNHEDHKKFNGDAYSFVAWLNKKGVNY